ncbi:sensor histidine kinase [Solimicrobium silvestre]|uniref:Histidine kinase n=1 Tax=Solimicrobium silvestre TaxID=2099400 RepID=A0A2S9GXQ7_9BURK|nr:histidine kinase [Solimicrobium silvestre]PRC92491.1 Histidine kinase [Solimicrobium silvestre]
MKTENRNAPSLPKLNLAAWQKLSKIFALNLVAWLTFTSIGALTSFNDDLRSGLLPDYWEIFKDWGNSAIALALLSFVIYAIFSRWPQVIANGKKIILSYGVLLLFLLPLNLFYVVKFLLSEANQSMNWVESWNASWDVIQTQILVIDDYSSLLRLSSVTAVFFAVVIVKIWQRSQARDKAWEQEHAHNLSLRLELEEQRLSALRAQLEPHFMFNALNAISALVLTDNKENALNGIHGLSELLRYALTVSEKNSVKLSEELAFLNDYIALQKLRYGSRLQITIDGVDDVIGEVNCPPLLLQPLVENALRHNLDCHQHDSDIHLSFSQQQTNILIRISNPLHDTIKTTGSNPGAGLGLRNTRARLQLAYGAYASLQTSVVNGRFQVDLLLPVSLNDYLND